MPVIECNDDGLYYREWPVDGAPKGVVMLVHGLGEHCQRYEALAARLNQSMYAVNTMDLPNHGLSDGDKGHVESFSLFQDAVSTLLQRTIDKYPNTPVFLLGHSMGGLISSRFLIDHQQQFKGAVLSGAAIESPQAPPAWQVSVITLVAKLFPKLGMLELDGALVSRDPAVVEAYESDVLNNHNKLSAKLLVELFGAMDDVKQHASKIELPMLIMHGREDGLTAPSGSQWLFDNISSKDKALKFYDGLFHEIFNEPEAPQIYEDVVAWLDAR